MAAGCDECHEQGTGATTLKLWQETTRKLFNRGRDNLARIERAPEEARRRAARAIEGARSKLDAVERDGSWGVHNQAIVDLLLQEAEGLIGEASELVEYPDSETKGEKE